MLAKRIIPTLLCRGRTLIKGKQFHGWRSVGVVEQAVRIYQARGVDELILVDIAATKECRGPDLKLVEELTRDCFMPLTVGGGVRRVQDVRDLLSAGADKVAVGTSAYIDPYGIYQMIDAVGGQAIVVSVDVRDGQVWSDCGTRAHKTTALRFAKRLEIQGVGEILLTAIDREGMMEGYDIDLIREVAGAVEIPVIAHGGCGTYDHMLQAIEVGASAVAAGSMFQFSDCTPAGAAQYLTEHGIEVRQHEEQA